MKNEATENFWQFLALFGGGGSNLGPFCPKIVLVTPNFFFDKLLIYLKNDISAKFQEDLMKNEGTEHFWHFLSLFGGDGSNFGPFCPKIALVTPKFFLLNC